MYLPYQQGLIRRGGCSTALIQFFKKTESQNPSLLVRMSGVVRGYLTVSILSLRLGVQSSEVIPHSPDPMDGAIPSMKGNRT